MDFTFIMMNGRIDKKRLRNLFIRIYAEVNMQTIKGLTSLYELYKSALNRNQEYLDPNHVTGIHPINVAILEYTLNFKQFYVRGDTKNFAMEEFCNLYEEKINSGKKVSNLLDPDILVVDGKSLRIPGNNKAEGLYFVLK